MVMSVWDDEYGISVHAKYQTTKENISEILKGFQRDSQNKGYEIMTVLGWDYAALVGTYQKAAQIADIHKSIINFKDGYDTRVGEKGVTLSGGQKQRLVIARTIISKAPILVFDDSLSAVDTETDMNIRAALKKRQEQSTTLIITHRVATAKDADKIVVLDQGKIAEVGTHEQLIKQSGLYKRIFEIQTRMV
jgi:ABC-type multidrug transport system fused ATPase/permease subunit